MTPAAILRSVATDHCTTDEILALRTQILVARRADRETVARTTALLERFPESPDLRVLHGRALLLAARDLEGAAASFEHALALEPGHRDATEALRELRADVTR